MHARKPCQLFHLKRKNPTFRAPDRSKMISLQNSAGHIRYTTVYGVEPVKQSICFSYR